MPSPNGQSEMAYKLAIPTMSLGRASAGHLLEHKLDMARMYGYRGIELFHEDLIEVASRVGSVPTADERNGDTGATAAAQLVAAKYIGQLCQSRGLEILCLQPFWNYEGLVDRTAHARLVQKLALWLLLARELGTDIIQIPSNFLPADQVTDDVDLMARDLRQVADMGLKQTPRPVRFAYESLAWGTRVDTWERCWDMVRRVDRPNFGMVLDTYNIAARVYADPAVPGGVMAEGTHAGAAALAASIERMLVEVDVEKVFYVQVVDAERLADPLVEGHAFYDAQHPARMSWSRNCRLFYGEKDHGAYLPVKEIAWAFFHGLGFKGWVSMELFHRRTFDTDDRVPEELAIRGATSFKRLKRDLGLDKKNQKNHLES